MGFGNYFGPYSVIEGPCRIGNNNWFAAHSAIGAVAQWSGTPGSDMAAFPRGGVAIGNENVFREFVTVHQGTDRTTSIGSNCYLMATTHVGHDSFLRDGVVLSLVQLGGHSIIGERANLGLGVVVHQRVVIGAHAMVGMQSAVNRPIPPGAVAYGTPARIRGANRVGLTRSGVDERVIANLDEAFASARAIEEMELPDDIRQLVADYSTDLEINR